ncbi:DUF1294 domain-containing protein [Chryseobacterium nematophagum]|uniref:DUF1294 domain-containing protein n=1 Tax=Chryseobacterium nematophagum TaxID=2305228 RepID=A0A3M7TKA5_9FLAO|nr:DUF1294 domain-containing protein [Chryseobacterium nematophagum]
MYLFFIVFNMLSLGVFGLDKYRAIRHQRRISESFLLTITFFGGTIGALLGMLIFRHKVAKRSFILKIILVILLQIMILYGLYRLGLFSVKNISMLFGN